MSERPHRTLRSWVWMAVAATGLIAVLLLVLGLEDRAEVAVAADGVVAPPVSVTARSTATRQARLVGFAQIRPLWSATLTANVGGRITRVSDQALAGRQVAAGDVLVQIEDSHLRADLQAMRQAVAEAELARIRARNASDIARRETELAGVRDPTDLQLRLPELRIAEQQLETARAQLVAAETDLADATVTAPFDGVMTDRQVSPGQTVSPGETLLSLLDRSQFELEAGLSERQWQLLERPIRGQEALIESLAGRALARARIRDAGGFRDAATREYKVFLDVTQVVDGAVLLSGDLVRVVFTGRAVEDTLAVPETAFTREGHVWLLDGEDRLQRVDTAPLWRDGGEVVLPAPDGPGRYRVVIMPLAGYLPGQRVDVLPARGRLTCTR